MGACISSSRRTAIADGGIPSKSSFSGASVGGKERRRLRKAREKRGGSVDGRGSGVRGSGRSYGSADGEVGEEELHRLPGRLFLNSCSDVACLYSQQGKKGTNQDAMIVWENFMQRSDTIFCGVFDGHGPFGHMVAKKVRDSLPLKLSMQWTAQVSGQESPERNASKSWSTDSEEMASSSMDDEWIDSTDSDDKVPEMYFPLKQSLLKAFQLMDKELKFHPTLDCFCSGSTAVTLVKQGQDLVIGNVGDSRAIIGTRDVDNNLIAIQLTVDLKPNLPREAARIQKCKGRVFALQDEPEVARVWLPNNDSPGLAMARAFGDFCLKDYGLISVPDITYRHLTENDEFIVLATDGVWDVLSNKEVVDIVSSAPTRGTAARALVESAVRAWRLKFPTSKIDDCAVVCLYLESPLSIDSCKVGDCETAPESAEVTVSGLTLKQPEEEETHVPVTIEANSSTVPTLKHSYTLCETDEIVPVYEGTKAEGVPERIQSTRSLADCISTAEDEEWSALEGVTRVNSLVNLPRFLSSDKNSSSWKKWL